MRQAWLDTYRGVAVVFMVTVHYLYAFAPAGWRTGLWATMDLWAGTAMSLFFYAVGASASLSKKGLRDALPGCLMLIGLGLVFHQMWEGVFLPLNPSGIFVVLGLGRILCTGLRGTSRRLRIILAAALTLAYYLLRPIDTLGLSPLMVCLVPCLIGSLQVSPKSWMGLSLIVLGYVLNRDLGIVLTKPSLSPSYLAFSLGVCLTVHAASKRLLPQAFLKWFGRHSLEAYLIHHILQVWLLVVSGAGQYEAQTLAYASLICLGWILVYHRVTDKRKRKEKSGLDIAEYGGPNIGVCRTVVTG